LPQIQSAARADSLLIFTCRHEAELTAAAAQPLPDDDDDLIE